MRIQVSESTFEASEFHTCQFSESNKKLRAKLLELLHFLWKELAVGFTIHNGGGGKIGMGTNYVKAFDDAESWPLFNSPRDRFITEISYDQTSSFSLLNKLKLRRLFPFNGMLYISALSRQTNELKRNK